MHSYNTTEEAILKYFAHKVFGTTDDVGVPDLFSNNAARDDNMEGVDATGATEAAASTVKVKKN